MCCVSSQTVLQQAFGHPASVSDFSPEPTSLYSYRGAPPCLLVHKHKDRAPPLNGYYHLKVNLTGLKQTDLKLLQTLALLKLMWVAEDLKGSEFNPGTDGEQ